MTSPRNYVTVTELAGLGELTAGPPPRSEGKVIRLQDIEVVCGRCNRDRGAARGTWRMAGDLQDYLPVPVLHIEHRVNDLDMWLRDYASRAPLREQVGVTEVHVLQADDDPLYIGRILHELEPGA